MTAIMRDFAALFSEGPDDAPAEPARQRRRRAALFRETAGQRVARHALGLAFALKPKRLAGIPAILDLVTRDFATGAKGLPDPARALNQPDGLCGVVHDLSPATLMAAYAQSLYPWAHTGPLKWWSPARRMVVDPAGFRSNANVRRVLRRGDFTVTFDRDFEGVIAACAAPRRHSRLLGYGLTWITPRLMHAFARLHDAGHAHSFEVWDKDGRLVGGGYGVAVGGVFVTESQFSHVSNASKAGFAVLNRHLEAWGFVLNDGKHPTPTLVDMGFEPVPRDSYRSMLEREGAPRGPHVWRVDDTLLRATLEGRR